MVIIHNEKYIYYHLIKKQTKTEFCINQTFTYLEPSIHLLDGTPAEDIKIDRFDIAIKSIYDIF